MEAKTEIISEQTGTRAGKLMKDDHGYDANVHDELDQNIFTRLAK